MSQPLFCLGKARETALFEAVEGCLLSAYPDISVKHDRTQTAFISGVQFAWVSQPRRKSDAGAVMLSIGLPQLIHSPRFLHAAEVSPGRFMHHMLLRAPADLDDEVRAWLEWAWAFAQMRRRGR